MEHWAIYQFLFAALDQCWPKAVADLANESVPDQTHCAKRHWCGSFLPIRTESFGISGPDIFCLPPFFLSGSDHPCGSLLSYFLFYSFH